MFNVNFSNCGWREATRLASFIELMLNDVQYCIYNTDCDISYDMHYDEPRIDSGFNTLYASDFDVAFDNEDHASFI